VNTITPKGDYHNKAMERSQMVAKNNFRPGMDLKLVINDKNSASPERTKTDPAGGLGSVLFCTPQPLHIVPLVLL
jgi:hypothetical protein